MTDRHHSVAHEILSYLMKHPDAQDTVEGIAEWWLLERYLRRQLDVVKKSVEELTARGLLLERRSRDSRVHYRINPEKISEIEELLAE